MIKERMLLLNLLFNKTFQFFVIEENWHDVVNYSLKIFQKQYEDLSNMDEKSRGSNLE